MQYVRSNTAPNKYLLRKINTSRESNLKILRGWERYCALWKLPRQDCWGFVRRRCINCGLNCCKANLFEACSRWLELELTGSVQESNLKEGILCHHLKSYENTSQHLYLFWCVYICTRLGMRLNRQVIRFQTVNVLFKLPQLFYLIRVHNNIF